VQRKAKKCKGITILCNQTANKCNPQICATFLFYNFLYLYIEGFLINSTLCGLEVFMKNFIKIMCILLLVSAVAFAQEVNLNVETDLKVEIQPFQKMKVTGIALSVFGPVLIPAGIIVLNNSPEGLGNLNASIAQFIVGFCITGIGIGATVTGITLTTIGAVKVKQKRLKEALPNSAYVAPNGAGFTWNF